MESDAHSAAAEAVDEMIITVGKLMQVIACADTLVEWIEEKKSPRHIAFALERYKEARASLRVREP